MLGCQFVKAKLHSTLLILALKEPPQKDYFPTTLQTNVSFIIIIIIIVHVFCSLDLKLNARIWLLRFGPFV